MIRSLATLIYGIAVAVLIVTVAILAAIWVIGLAAKATLFGDSRASLAMKIFERIQREAKKPPTDITHITPNNGE